MKKSDMREELVQLGNGAQVLAIQILDNPEDAADAVHDAFITALSKPGHYDPKKGPLKPWFYRVVRNSCIDRMRKRRALDQLVEEPDDTGPSPDQRVEDHQRDRKLQTALARLNPDQRQIVVLRDYLDMPYAEISAVLDIAPGTVMSRLHRARMALKTELERHDR